MLRPIRALGISTLVFVRHVIGTCPTPRRSYDREEYSTSRHRERDMLWILIALLRADAFTGMIR